MRARLSPLLAAGLLLALAIAAPAQAQVNTQSEEQERTQGAGAGDTANAPVLPAGGPFRALDLYPPRNFGYLLGDAIRHEIEIALDPAYHIEPASLPRARALTYWLNLQNVRLEDLGIREGTRRYRLWLDYQTFYAPLEPKRLEIPALTLTASDGIRSTDAKVPAWSFVMTPLREVAGSASGEALRLRSDIAPANVPTRRLVTATIGAAGVALLALAALAAQFGWGPFRRMRARPFAAALRAIRRAGPELDSSSTSSDSPVYRDALLALHRALDATAGRRVLAEDLPGFLDDHPDYRPAAPELETLFAASRRLFFAADAGSAGTLLAPKAVPGLARRLSAIERTAA
ncbi:nonribosomal peptide synthetase MxaA [Ancylobacter sp. 6x-1]|uniref:Nonribosomal peptide synthetase MxaA n=1 Tax=Ancylobacter crimeensis TaxID=2579147 RepID=A0ABT0DDA2_9HYPH|nr:nonribosomal peptide synthetase MxaA [Ancylobacter crimeensis]MCK0197953.1 nonribosomal peptide synthetase MxaA [Ancylobacter crimeensis]